jgi:uncharacterized membrane protein
MGRKGDRSSDLWHGCSTSMPRLASTLDFLAHLLERLWTQRWRVAGLIAYGAAPGYAFWLVRNDDQLRRLAANKLSRAATGEMLPPVLVSLALMLVVVAVVHLRRRGLDRARSSPGGSIRTLATSVDLCLRRGAPVLTLPLIAALATPKLETTSPWFTLTIAAVVAAVFGVWTTQFPVQTLASARRRIHVWLPAALACVATLGFVDAVGELALLHHRNLATSTYDLGIYDSLMWNASQGHGLRSTLVRGDNHAAAHFDPILILLSPVYWVRPGAETLLVVQTVWIATGALPLYVLAQRKLGSHWAGLALALCYLAHPGIHGAALYQFHSLSLAIPLLIAAVALLELDRTLAYAAVVLGLLLVREDIALLTGMLGLYAVLSGRGRVGIVTILVSITYLVAVKTLVMPDAGLLMADSDESYGYSRYFKYLIRDKNGGVSTLLRSLISNPIFVVRSMVSEAKLLYVARCLGPLLCLPLFARPGRLLLAYGLGFCLLASRDAVYSQHFQYITLHVPYAFALVPVVLAAPDQSPALRGLLSLRPGLTRAVLVRAALTSCLAGSALVSWKYGALVENNSFRSGFGRLQRTWTEDAESRHAWVVAVAAELPPDTSVAASNRLVPHLSSRYTIERFHDGDWREVDFLVVDRNERRPKHVAAKLRKVERSGAYRVIDEHPSGLVLLVRDPEVPIPPKPEQQPTPTPKPKPKPTPKPVAKPEAAAAKSSATKPDIAKPSGQAEAPEVEPSAAKPAAVKPV